MSDVPSAGTKKNVSPGISILLIVLALGLILGVMWFKSEAPMVNKLPTLQTTGMPSGPSSPAAETKDKSTSPPLKPANATGGVDTPKAK
jgi:hypothetical protein